MIFIGFQAEGTLGRRILDGTKKVKIMGELINVAAKIYSLQGFSAHADQAGLLTGSTDLLRSLSAPLLYTGKPRNPRHLPN
ncbi:MAG: MBL fold metallo-hydrolase RNA specificity domain-containing protein [Syntrophaceticus schinkii]